MMKGKIKAICDFVVKHSMIIFPALVVASVAATVAIALGAGNSGEPEIQNLLAKEDSLVVAGAPESLQTLPDNTVSAADAADFELEKNEDPTLYALIEAYYNALAEGDTDTIRTLSNFVKDTEAVRIQQWSKYIENYPLLEIYTKLGPEENSWIVYVYHKVVFSGYEEQVPGFRGFYVCTDENGALYFNDGVTQEDVLDYIRTASQQDDVADLNNRVNVEYTELMTANKKLFEYITELEREVSISTGEVLASQNVEGEQADENENVEDNADAAADQNLIGTATTTVNVRVSDSELADKLGKLSSGQQVQVLEQRPNGWTKIIYEKKEGYVKSEYLLVTGG